MLFVCCAYAGFGISDWFKRRRLFFGALIDYLDALERGIAYAKMPLPQLTQSFREGKKGDFFALLDAYCKDIAGQRRTECKSLLLSAYERRAVADMLNSLGKYDTETQLAELGRYRTLFAPIRDKCAENYDKTGKLAAKLGVLAGIAAMLALA